MELWEQNKHLDGGTSVTVSERQIYVPGQRYTCLCPLIHGGIADKTSGFE
jgi:hypothetical protein